jgi:hypothetical protein
VPVPATDRDEGGKHQWKKQLDHLTTDGFDDSGVATHQHRLRKVTMDA